MSKEVVEVHVQSESESNGVVQCNATVCTSELCVQLERVTASRKLLDLSAQKSIAALLTRVLQYRADRGEAILSAQAEQKGVLDLDELVGEIQKANADFQL